MDLRSNSTGETLELGRKLGTLLALGDVVSLTGELGTGKTVMVRGIASGLGHSGAVTSPTFTIIHTYSDARLCHVDAFRLSSAADLIDAGIDEYLDGEWICAVEWAERVIVALPDGALCIRIAFGRGDDERLITIDDCGGWAERLSSLEGSAWFG